MKLITCLSSLAMAGCQTIPEVKIVEVFQPVNLGCKTQVTRPNWPNPEDGTNLQERVARVVARDGIAQKDYIPKLEAALVSCGGTVK